MNKVIIKGNVGGKPTVVNFDNGGKCASFSVATNERAFKTSNGQEIPERTDWHRCVAFNGLAGVIEQYVDKGTPVLLSGKLRNRDWKRDDGSTQQITEIHIEDFELLGSKPNSVQPPVPEPPAPTKKTTTTTTKQSAKVEVPYSTPTTTTVPDDELPF